MQSREITHKGRPQITEADLVVPSPALTFALRLLSALPGQQHVADSVRQVFARLSGFRPALIKHPAGDYTSALSSRHGWILGVNGLD
jgi:hypothetical protein